MSNSQNYRCEMCGNRTGEPAKGDAQDWFWKRLPAGRVGPFCSEACARRLTLDGDPQFTVPQIYRLEYWREQAKAHDHAPAVLFEHWTEKEGEKWVEHINLVPVGEEV